MDKYYSAITETTRSFQVFVQVEKEESSQRLPSVASPMTISVTKLFDFLKLFWKAKLTRS